MQLKQSTLKVGFALSTATYKTVSKVQLTKTLELMYMCCFQWLFQLWYCSNVYFNQTRNLTVGFTWGRFYIVLNSRNVNLSALQCKAVV